MESSCEKRSLLTHDATELSPLSSYSSRYTKDDPCDWAPTSSPDSQRTQHILSYAWQPGTLSRIPFTGIGSLAGAILCIVLAGKILDISDEEPVTSWQLSPAVYLAIVSAIGMAFVSYAQYQSSITAWWASSLRGARISQLHRQWDQGTSLWAALSSRPAEITFTSLAKISVAACLVSGPLLQRASSIKTISLADSQMLDIPVVRMDSEFNFTNFGPKSPGLNQKRPDLAGSRVDEWISDEFVDVIRNYTRKIDILIRGISFNGTYFGTIQTLGLNGSCELVQEKYVDWAYTWVEEAMRAGQELPANNSLAATILNVTFDWDWPWEGEDPDCGRNNCTTTWLPRSLIKFNVTFSRLNPEHKRHPSMMARGHQARPRATTPGISTSHLFTSPVQEP